MAKEEPLREMDLAFFEMFELFTDILIRMGVPKEEFEQQFAHTVSKVKNYPQAKYIIEKFAKYAAERAVALTDLERIHLLHGPTQGSA